MLLRRITEHVKEQNWTAVGIDFVIVVVGVFIGLQVANWNDARQDRAEETVFLQDLHNDLLLASKQSARTEAIRFKQAEDLETGAELIFSEQANRALTEAECTAIAFSHTNNVSRSRLPALIHLQSSGRMSIVSDRTLARELAELTQRQEVLDTFIRDTGGITIAIANKYPNLFQTKAKWTRVGNSIETERDVETICQLENLVTNQALINDLTTNVDAYDAFMRDGFVPWVEQMRRVQERVDILLGLKNEEQSP